MKILFIMPRELGVGGIETVTLAYWKQLLQRGHKIDFVCHGFERGIHDDEIENEGSLIYRVPIKSKNFWGNIRAINNVIKNGKYDVVHAHMNATSGIYLKIAKKYGVKCRVSHSHCSSYKAFTSNLVKIIINEIEKNKTSKYATIRLACSEMAGKWLYGRKNFYVVQNGVDVELYKYDEYVRRVMRKQLNIKDDEILLGHIGSFIECKNHRYLIDVFQRVYQESGKYKLVLVGDGELQGDIKKYVCERKLQNNVIFLGQRNDIWKCLQAMDVFLLPSISEGAPVAAIEAQANGLKCIFSNGISREVFINETTIGLDITDEDKNKWVVECLLPAKRTNINKTKFDSYNWKNIVDYLEKLYRGYL